MNAQRSSERERAARDAPQIHRNLPRLDPTAYRGIVHVHWIFTIRGRKHGYLTPEFFLRFQLIATHAFLRYHLVSPCLCLMPDHLHLLLMGLDEQESDQRLAIHFLRRHLKPFLHPFEFQRPAYDHVLRKEEKRRQAFEETAGYIIENPVRAGLGEHAREWPYSTAIIPGYP